MRAVGDLRNGFFYDYCKSRIDNYGTPQTAMGGIAVYANERGEQVQSHRTLLHSKSVAW